MGTKSNPGKFDCYNKLADDEPFFVLRAKDPTAPGLVMAWRALRAGNISNAQMCVGIAFNEWANSNRTNLALNTDKSQEAMECANDMMQWLKDNQPEK